LVKNPDKSKSMQEQQHLSQTVQEASSTALYVEAHNTDKVADSSSVMEEGSKVIKE